MTSDKDGPESAFERELPEAEVVISQPFWPAYLTAERIAKAPNLKLAITAGIGSDHVDLQAAIERGITVAEVTYCNSISVSEHVVMMILALVRNYIPSYQQVVEGGWNIADCASRSYDLEGMQVGTVGAGRIGSAVLRRLKPFEVGCTTPIGIGCPGEVEEELGVIYHPTAESLVEVCDVVTINAPLHPETEHMFDEALIGKMKRGAYLVNTARGKICDRDAIARALEADSLPGTPATSGFRSRLRGTTVALDAVARHDAARLRHGLSAQARYAAGVGRSWSAGSRPPDARGVPDRRGRRAGGRGRALLQRGRRDRGLRGGGAIRGGLTAPPSARRAKAFQHAAQYRSHLGPRRI